VILYTFGYQYNCKLIFWQTFLFKKRELSPTARLALSAANLLRGTASAHQPRLASAISQPLFREREVIETRNAKSEADLARYHRNSSDTFISAEKSLVTSSAESLESVSSSKITASSDSKSLSYVTDSEVSSDKTSVRIVKEASIGKEMSKRYHEQKNNNRYNKQPQILDLNRNDSTTSVETNLSPVNSAKLRELRAQVDMLHNEKLEFQETHQSEISRLHDQIQELRQTNTQLNTQLNTLPTPISLSSNHDLENLLEISEKLNDQVEILKDQFNILPIKGERNVLKRMQKHVPIWVDKFEDLGPLVNAYDLRLKVAYKKLLVATEKNAKLEFELEQNTKEQQNLQSHLTQLSKKCENLTEDARGLVSKTDMEEKLKHERSLFEKERENFETKLSEFNAKSRDKDDEIDKLRKELEKSVEINAKYIATEATLLEEVKTLAFQNNLAKKREQEWRLHVNKSVSLLEKAVHDRDIYHQLAAREHENCRHAINSASTLKLSHLRDLSKMFKENLENGNSVGYHSGRFHTLANEIKLIKASVNKRQSEIVNRGNNMQGMINEIEQMTEKIMIPEITA